MSITFRIATAADDRDGPVATINARQLAAFRTFLRRESARSATVLLDPDAAEETYLSYHFEARVCPLALASIARVFDFDADVITVVEEAQFRCRRVSVFRNEPAGTIASVGEIPVDAIRDRLANPAIRRRAAEEGVTGYLDRLEQLLATADADDTSRLEWA